MPCHAPPEVSAILYFVFFFYTPPEVKIRLSTWRKGSRGAFAVDEEALLLLVDGVHLLLEDVV